MRFLELPWMERYLSRDVFVGKVDPYKHKGWHCIRESPLYSCSIGRLSRFLITDIARGK
jgi:hypothetical protein